MSPNVLPSPLRDNNVDAAAAVFTKDFEGYKKMAAADYLEHKLLFGAVEDYLKSTNKPLRILDLGCGDSQNVAKLFKRNPSLIASYTGVDMSQAAISLAFEAVTDAMGRFFPVALHLSDMLSFLKSTSATYDIVFAAFALHHLSSDDKAEVLKEIHRLVNPVEGSFVMGDPFRREGETLEAYRQRATEVGNTWILMGAQRQQEFIKHMQDYDIVEPEAFFEEVSQTTGYRSMEVICRGQKGLQSCITVFRP